MSVDAIVDAVWGTAPPPSARNGLHVYVTKLRRVLEPNAAGGKWRIIVRRGPGYVLEAGAVDATFFEELAREGRTAIEAGDASRAEARLRAALSLWRGRPLADFEYEAFAQEEIARLEALHFQCRDALAEATLAQGRADEAVTQFELLTREQPLSERRTARLMTALYRAGQQADALAAYRRLRSVLRRELGIEPGRELRELERAILRHELPTPRGAHAGNLLAETAALLPDSVRRRVATLADIAEPIDGADAPEATALLERAVAAASAAAGSELEWFGRELQQALPDLERAGDHDALARVWHELAVSVYKQQVRAAEMERAAARAVAYCELAGAGDRRAFALLALADATVLGETPTDEAIVRIERILVENDGDARVRACVLPQLSRAYSSAGRWSEARAVMRRARELRLQNGWPMHALGTHLLQAEIELSAGKYEAAEREVRVGVEGLRIFGGSSHPPVNVVLAEALSRHGRIGDCASELAALHAEGEPRWVGARVMWRQTEARVLTFRGKHTAAQRLAREAVAHADTTDSSSLRGMARLALAEVLLAGGREDPASVAADEAAAIYRRKRFHPRRWEEEVFAVLRRSGPTREPAMIHTT